MSVRLSVCVRVPCPKAAPIKTNIVKRRTPERVLAADRRRAITFSLRLDVVGPRDA